MPSYITKALNTPIPQSRPTSARQVKNSAGGYVFTVNPDDAFRRFLILGTSEGTYYLDRTEMTQTTTQVAQAYVASKPIAALEQIVDVSTRNLAPRVDQVLYGLALCLSSEDYETRMKAVEAFPRVVRTGGHLLMITGFLDAMRGWGTTMKKAYRNWYSSKTPHDLMLHFIKYRQRDGWSQRDVLRLARPKPSLVWEHEAFAFAVGKVPSETNLPTDRGALGEAEVRRMRTFFSALQMATSSKEAARLIVESRLPHEALLSEHRNSKEVWQALLPDLPYHALLRSLSTLERLQLTGANRELVTSKLRKPAARVHPMSIFLAAKAYELGRPQKGTGSSWAPQAWVKAALQAAVLTAFRDVEPIDRSLCLALDVSGSMQQGMVLGNVTAAEAEVVMTLALLKAAPNAHVGKFAGSAGRGGAGFHPANNAFVDVDWQGRRLDDILRTEFDVKFGGTDCALPILWATQQKRSFDAFVMFTDNESYQGMIHTHTALAAYRKKVNPKAKLIVCAFTATAFSVGDPQDPLTLNVVGLSADLPQVIRSFVSE